MPFFEELERSPRRNPPTPFDTNAGRILATYLLDHKLTTARPRAADYANEIKLMRLRDGITEERITATLDWYVTHKRTAYTPHVYSANTFRLKFTQLEEAMQRYQEPVELSHGDRVCAERLQTRMGLVWPAGTTKEEELVAIGNVMICFARFYIGCYRAKNDATVTGTREYGIIKFICGVCPNATQLTEEVMSKAHALAVAHPARWVLAGPYSRRLRNEALPHWLARTGPRWCDEYAGEPELWPRIKELIERCMP